MRRSAQRVRFRLSQASQQCADVLFCLRFRLPSLICLRGSGELRGDDTRYANACNREHLLITSPKYRRVRAAPACWSAAIRLR